MTFTLLTKKIKKILHKKPKLFLYSGALLLSLFFAMIMNQKKTEEKLPLKQKRYGLDTFIPKGFVLIPIEVQNYKSLDSALGQYGIVDLYASTLSNPSKFKRIAKNIKILRSPYPPYEFAVMTPEEKAKFIMEINGSIKVAIQNPKKTGTDFEFFEKKEKPQRRIKRKLLIEL